MIRRPTGVQILREERDQSGAGWRSIYNKGVSTDRKGEVKFYYWKTKEK